MEELSVGIVGCGHIATETHIPNYTSSNIPTSVIAACDLDYQQAMKVSKEYDIPSTYDDVEEMLQIEELDIVDICTPPGTHKDIGMMALQNGCHIFVEKPLTLSSQNSEALIKTADENNVFIGVMHNMLYNKPIINARNKIKAGEIGQLSAIRINLMNPSSDGLNQPDHWYHDLPGGIMTETLPHIAYITLDLMKSVSSVEVFGTQTVGHDWAPHDEYDIIFENDSTICSTHLSYSSPHRAMSIDIIGTDGYLQLDLLVNGVYSYNLSEMDFISLGQHSIGQISQQIKNLVDNVGDVLTKNAAVGSTIVQKNFIESIQKDEPPKVDGEAGLRTVEVVEKAYENYQSKY